MISEEELDKALDVAHASGSQTAVELVSLINAEIRRLREENERLTGAEAELEVVIRHMERANRYRKVLEEYANEDNWHCAKDHEYHDDDCVWDKWYGSNGDGNELAKEALQPKEGGDAE